jgi:peptidoglycan/LPS O-acetylase OafA/YrhL
MLLWASTRGGQPSIGTSYLGRMGVAIFFVISGLVIYRPFVVARRGGRRIDWNTHAIRRLVRIFPAYLLALGVFGYVIPFRAGTVDMSNPWALAALGQIYTSRPAGLPVAWTLCIEVSFYLAVPLVAAVVAGRRQGLEPWLLIGLGLGSTIVHITVPGVVPATLLGYFGWFVAGMLLARLSPASTRPLSVPPWAIWALVALGYLFVVRHLTPLGHPAGLGAKAWDYIGVGLLGAAAVLPAVTNPGRSYLRWLGDRSYGVYLWHFPVFMFLSQRTSISSWAYILAGTAATLLAAHLSYGCLERPLMNRVTASQKLRLARHPPAPGPRSAGAVA